MKRIASVLICALSLACAMSVQAATVTVPQGGLYNGLTFSGDGALSFSPELQALLESGGVQVLGYSGGPTPVGDISLGLNGVGSLPLSSLLTGLPPSNPPSTDAALQDFLQALQLIQLGSSSGINQIVLEGVTASVPEPTTLPLMGLGMVAIALVRRTRRA